jgi:hypothetical protein
MTGRAHLVEQVRWPTGNRPMQAGIRSLSWRVALLARRAR